MLNFRLVSFLDFYSLAIRDTRIGRTMTADTTPTTATTVMSEPPVNQPATTTIYWQPCLQLQRPPPMAATLPSFVYPHPKHSSPTIVGVAIKRTLKSPDTSSMTSSANCAATVDTSNSESSNRFNNRLNDIKSGIVCDEQLSGVMPQVISDSQVDEENPFRDLFLRKLREKDVAFISERMGKDFFQETILLMGKASGDRHLVDRLDKHVEQGE